MNTINCQYVDFSTKECCNKRTEGNTNFCATHNRMVRKEVENMSKAAEKRKITLQKAKAKSMEPRKGISKNPKDWSNTFLCSDGTRVTQPEIDRNRRKAYEQKYPQTTNYKCEGCEIHRSNSHAHIIPQARCKNIGKTELIWHPDNFFMADHKCNAAIENPKGKEWRALKNIDKCLAFIKLHDPELFMKFELSSINQENEPHKI